MISFVNRRHINASKIDEAIRNILNQYNQFSLPRLWGDGKTAAADGTKFDLYEENLISEYHIRYGGYGGLHIIMFQILILHSLVTSFHVEFGKQFILLMVC